MMIVRFGKYWLYNEAGKGWINIGCPIIDNKKGSESFSVKRQVYREFKELEETLKGFIGIIGWVAWTYLENAHIMRFFAKLGAKPYGIDLKNNQLWFCKEFKTR